MFDLLVGILSNLGVDESKLNSTTKIAILSFSLGFLAFILICIRAFFDYSSWEQIIFVVLVCFVLSVIGFIIGIVANFITNRSKK